MNIIIVGCGKVGVSILSSLVAEGHDVTAVDSSAEVIEELTNVYDVMGVCRQRSGLRDVGGSPGGAGGIVRGVHQVG